MNGYNHYSQPGSQYPPQQRGGYGMGGGHFSPRNGGGMPHHSAMGFHSEGGHMGGRQHGYSAEDNDDGEYEDVLAFFRAVAYGEMPCPEELKQIIIGVVGEQANGMLAEYGYQQQGDPERHRRYKKTLEELRDIPNVTEAVKRAEQHFDNLTNDHKKVLHQILNRPSYKRMAKMVNMSPERFMELMSELESIYKL